MSEQYRTIRDTVARQGMVVPQCSVLRDVVELKRSYRGLWSWAGGSFTVTVPKEDCERVKDSEA